LKKSLIYSLILHILLFSLAFYLAQGKTEKVLKPFYARIVSPDELKEEGGIREDKEAEGIMPFKKQPSVTTIPSQRKGGPRSPEQKGEKKADGEGIQYLETERSKMKPGSAKDISGTGQSQQMQKSLKGMEHIEPPPMTLKEKLFDRDIISKSAKKERKEKTKSESTITFDTEEFKYYGYLQRLKEKIEGIWKYPPDAAERGIYGDLYIKFTIKKNGKLGAVELVRTSGHKSLDDAAIKALKDAEPYWPLPDELDKEGLTITGHFIYSIYGIYIR
jgi:protein TonB